MGKYHTENNHDSFEDYVDSFQKEPIEEILHWNSFKHGSWTSISQDYDNILKKLLKAPK